MTDQVDVPVQTTLSELFAKDPLKMVDADYNEIIKELRAMRQRYIANERGAGKVKITTVKIDPQAAKIADQLSLGDLGL